MVEYVETGSGEPVVMLHGAPTVPASLEAFVELFEEDRRVVLPKLYDLGQNADAVLPNLMAALRRADAEGAPILGHSFGAYRAFQLAVSSVFEVERIAAIGPLANQPDERLAEYDALADDLDSVEEAVPVADEMWFTEAYREAHDTAAMIRGWFEEVGLEALRACLRIEMQGPDLRPALAGIDVPVRIVVGEEDAGTPVEWSREMHELLPDSEIVVVQGSGHFPHLESPMQTLPVVQDFLAG